MILYKLIDARGRVFAAFATAALMLLGGCKSKDRPFALTNPELAPPTDFVREAPGCSPETLPELPVLPMPWNRRTQTFVPPGQTVPTFALDYEVVPLARVDRLRVSYEFDARNPVDATEESDTCPRTLAAFAFMPPSVANDVIRARVEVLDAEGYGRAGDVFASIGARSVVVSLAGLDLSSASSDDQWFALFEPAWGAPRIALMRVPDVHAETLTIPGLPSGPGRIALIQTASVAGQDDAVTLHAPEGFAGDFAAYTRGWYQTILTRDDEPTPALALIAPPDATPKFASLGDDVSWSPLDGPLVISCPAETGSGSVRLPCGTTVRAIVTGFATAELTAGATTSSIAPGASASLATTCPDGATETSWTVNSSSANGRGFDLVLRTEAP